MRYHVSVLRILNIVYLKVQLYRDLCRVPHQFILYCAVRLYWYRYWFKALNLVVHVASTPPLYR